MQFNSLHVLPSYKIPCAQLPLDILVTQKATHLKREHDKIKEEQAKKPLA
jgi:hypothetical protein